MRVPEPFNPLDKKNLGVSVADALLTQPVSVMPPAERFVGAGIYALYYVGDFEPYSSITAANRNNKFEAPIYVGKAVPAGARKGGFGLDLAPGSVMYARLTNDHAKSIGQVQNLRLEDFFCRYLIVEDIWIPLGESLLIEMFSPIWNRVIDGFGNHDPGRRRSTQQRSAWDVVHPGRPWVHKLAENPHSSTNILHNLHVFFAGGPAEVITGPALEEE